MQQPPPPVARRPRLMTNGSLSAPTHCETTRAPYYVSDIQNRNSQKNSQFRSFRSSGQLPQVEAVTCNRIKPDSYLATPSVSNHAVMLESMMETIDVYADDLNLSDEDCSVCPSTVADFPSSGFQQPDSVYEDPDLVLIFDQMQLTSAPEDLPRRGSKGSDLRRYESLSYGSMLDEEFLMGPSETLSSSASDNCLMMVTGDNIHLQLGSTEGFYDKEVEMNRRSMSQNGSGSVKSNESLMSLMTTTSTSGVGLSNSPMSPRRLPRSSFKSTSNMTSSSHGSLNGSLFGASRNFSDGRRQNRSSSSLLSPNYSPVPSTKGQRSDSNATVVFPCPTTSCSEEFVGREWLFKEIFDSVIRPQQQDGNFARAVLISGVCGTGKTAIVQHLAQKCIQNSNQQQQQSESTSCNNNYVMQRSGSRIERSPLSVCNNGSSYRGPQMSGVVDWSSVVARHVVAFHFCQLEDADTCQLPEFVCRLGAMLSNAPQLKGYRELLSTMEDARNALTLSACVSDPVKSFRTGIARPLKAARDASKLVSDQIFLVVIDGLDAAEFHRSECADSIGSFLDDFFMELPTNFKCILTASSGTKVHPSFAHHRISLDNHAADERLRFDVAEYISKRISLSASIQSNVMLPGSNSAQINRFIDHLGSLSSGNFLYLNLVLNLIHRNSLVMKTASYKALPQSINEVFLLLFNLKFPSPYAFDRCLPILSVLLASLVPPSSAFVFKCVNKVPGQQRDVSWEEFRERLNLLSDFVMEKEDGGLTLKHQALRSWLTKRQSGDTTKFLCDPKVGHGLIALGLCHSDKGQKTGNQVFQLANHLLKGQLHKNLGTEQVTPIAQAVHNYWTTLPSHVLEQALISEKNLTSHNPRVSRLLLMSGASPNAKIAFPGRGFCTILATAAARGLHELVSILLEFGADVLLASDDGTTALMNAAAAGQLDLVQLFHQHGARVSQLDKSQKCALVHAAENGHVPVASFLLHCDWSEDTVNHRFSDQSLAETVGINCAGRQAAAQRAFVLAAGAGHTQVCQFLLEFTDISIDEPEPVSGETALSQACLHGKKETIQFLLHNKAVPGYGGESTTGKPMSPLIQAAKSGCWDVVSLLLATGLLDVNKERAPDGRTALMVAAECGHIGVLELLLSRGADLNEMDLQQRTALFYAVASGSVPCATLLMERGSRADLVDNSDSTLLHSAAALANESMIRMLLDRGCSMDRTDAVGLRPLETAIVHQNFEALTCLLKHGAKLGPATWILAEKKPRAMLMLLNKLLEDGNLLYKRSRLKEAAQRYQYALKKCPTGSFRPEEVVLFDDVRCRLLLNFARCQKRANDNASATDLLSEALKVNPTSFEAFYLRARCYSDSGQSSLAVSDANDALRLCPTNREAAQLLASLKDSSVASTANVQIPANDYSCAPSSQALREPEATSKIPLLSTEEDCCSSTDSGHGADCPEDRSPIPVPRTFVGISYI